jgi:hypothetical protein
MDQFIQVYEKAFSDEYCNNVIEYFNVVDKEGFTKNRQDHEKADILDKDDLSMFLPSYELKHTNRNILDNFLNIFWGTCYKQYVEKFGILKTCAEHKTYVMKIQKTQPGQGYHTWHTEATNRDTSNRLLTWTVYLNDEFEAGETEFLYQHYRYKPQKGDCIIFPAAYTHTHRGNPPIGGDKYIITGWVEF